MSKSPKQTTIAGFPVERIAAGRHTLGRVEVNDDVSVIFLMNDGDGGTGPSGACLACKIGKISECAKVVCPDIKAADPNASCSDEISQCTELACKTSCKSNAFGGGGGFIIIA